MQGSAGAYKDPLAEVSEAGRSNTVQVSSRAGWSQHSWGSAYALAFRRWDMPIPQKR